MGAVQEIVGLGGVDFNLRVLGILIFHTVKKGEKKILYIYIYIFLCRKKNWMKGEREEREGKKIGFVLFLYFLVIFF